MIFTDRTIIVQKGTGSINDTIILYRGDKGVEIRFTLNEGSPFRFGSGASPNIIEKTEAAYGQLIIKTPNNLPTIFSEVAPTNEGKIVFTITSEMIDEITEVGNYTFQIRLLDESMNSRATLPEVVDGIEIREPISSEDITDTNEVNLAAVGYALTTAGANEAAFDENGNYNKTTWATGDRITAAKLNKIEDGIEAALQNSYDDTAIKTEIETLKDTDIAGIKTDIGTAQLTTTAQDLKSAINEVNTQCKDIAVKKIHQFDSVASMKSYDLSVGEVCCTLGYHAVNDGGGAKYYITSTATSSYGGIDVIPLDNGNKAVLIIDSDIVNSAVFGDSIESTDDTTFLNNLFRYSCATNIEVKMIKGKNYKTTGGLYFTTNFKVDFNNATLFLIDGSNRAFFENLDAYADVTEATKVRNVVIKNVNVNGNSPNNCSSTEYKSGIFIDAYNLSHCTFENIKLSYCYRNNFNIYYAEYLTFKDIDISHMGEEVDGCDIAGGNYGIEINNAKHITLKNIRGTDLVGGTAHIRYTDFITIDNLYCHNNYKKSETEGSVALTLTNCKYVKCQNIDMDTIDRNGIELNEQTINTSFENVKITNTLSPIVIGCDSDDTVVNSNVYFNNIKVSSTANTNYGVTINYVHGIVFDNFEINCLVGANNKIDGIVFRNGKITTGASAINGGSLFSSRGFEVQNVTINDIYYKHLIPNKIVNLIFTGQITQQSSVNLDLNFLKSHTNTFGELFIKSYFEPSPDQFYIAKYLFGLSDNTSDSGIISNLIIETGSNYRKVTPSISSPGILTLSTASDVDVCYIIELR